MTITRYNSVIVIALTTNISNNKSNNNRNRVRNTAILTINKRKDETQLTKLAPKTICIRMHYMYAYTHAHTHINKFFMK